MRARRPGLPVRELTRVDRIADVPNKNALVVWLVRIGSPSERRLLQPRYHDVVVQRHLDSPGIRGPWDGLYELRILRIGDVHDAPAVMPEMSHIKVPAAVYLLDGHLEGALAAVEAAISDGLHVACLPSRRNGICMAGRRETRRGKRKGSYGSTLKGVH